LNFLYFPFSFLFYLTSNYTSVSVQVRKM